MKLSHPGRAAQAQAEESQQDILLALKGEEVLPSPGGGIGLMHQPGLSLGHSSHPRLPAANALAAPSPLLQPLPGQLAQIGPSHPGHNQRGGDVPLHPLQPDIAGEDLLDSRYQLSGVIIPQGRVLPPLVLAEELRSLDDQGGIDLER